MRIENNKTFEGKIIRVVFDDELPEWYFSVVDVVEALADSTNPTDYLKKLRKRNPELHAYIGTNCPQVQLVTESGKHRKTLAANPKQLAYIIPFISSPKEEQFKKWVKKITNSIDGDIVQLPDMVDVQGEILLYQPDDTVRLEVLMENETVWLTQAQIIDLFQSSKSNISEHITNIYEQGELVYEATVRNFRTVQKEGDRMVNRVLTYYNLDAIISVGFRVNAKRGIKFRQWANGVIKNYLLRGYAVNQQLMRLEQHMDAKLNAQHREILKIESTLADHQEKIDFFVRTNQPPVEEQQYGRRIEVKEYNNRFHDRFLILDDALYHFGASFKDLGKRLFAFELMGIDKNIILNQL